MPMTVEKVRKLVALDPGDSLSRFALGKKLYEVSENLPEAAEHLRFANRASPGHLATYHILAKVLKALGERDEMRLVLEAGIQRVQSVGEGMGRDLGPAMLEMLAELDRDNTSLEEVTIRLANAHELVELRHRVLRAELGREAAIFPGDDAPTTLHALAEVGGSIACCATMMHEPHEGQPAWRLRGMATDEAYRSMKLGSKVLNFIETESQKHTPTGLLWCNARVGAVRFYQKHGWQVVTHEPYEIKTAGLHHTMVKCM